MNNNINFADIMLHLRNSLAQQPGNIMNDQGNVVGSNDPQDGVAMYRTPQPHMNSFHQQVQGVAEQLNNMPYGEQFNKNAWDARHTLNANRYQQLSPVTLQNILQHVQLKPRVL